MRTAALWDEWLDEDPLGEPVPAPFGGGKATYGVPILPVELGPDARLAVLLGFNVDPTADPTGWAMTDVSSSIEQAKPIRIVPGRADEQSITQAARAELTLKNPLGDYTPRRIQSRYFPGVHLGIPLWITADSGASGAVDRFTGFVDGLYPGWDSTGRYAVVRVTAKGILDRFGGQPPLRSPLHRTIVASNPVAYWQCADGRSATLLANAVAGGQPMTPSGGGWTIGGSDAPTGGAGSVTRAASLATLLGPLGLSGTSSYRVDVCIKPNASSVTNTFLVVHTLSGDQTFNLHTLGVGDGVWHHTRIEVYNNGGTATLDEYYDGVQTVSGSSLASAYADPISVEITTSAAGTNTDIISDIAAWSPRVTTDVYSAFTGYDGEGCWTRFLRLCREEGIPAAISTGATSGGRAMGPQDVDRLLNLLRECEAVDGGVMADG